MIKKVRIVNFKCIKGCFEVCFTEGINILAGNNESGKSTVLEAVHMALSGIFRGKSIKNNLTQYLFNYDAVKQYLSDVNSGQRDIAKLLGLSVERTRVIFSEMDDVESLGTNRNRIYRLNV